MNTKGQAAEIAALHYLEKQGLRCVQRNFTGRYGEIDLIMWHAKVLVFVEVRQRKSAQFGGAAASISPRKQQKMWLTAQQYCQTLSSLPACRFDAVLFDGASLPSSQIEWLQNIIQGE